MGIFRRAADSFVANLNDLVDRFEVPERMLRQALREMEVLLATTSAAVARSIATERLMEKSRAEHVARGDEWQTRAVAALEGGDDALARRAVLRQLEHQSAVATLDRQLSDVREANETLRRQLDVLRDKYAQARTRSTVLAAQQSATEAQRLVLTTSRAPHGESRALARFERYYEQIEFAQAEAMALIELEASDDAALESQFDRRANERSIDDELARLKATCCPADP